MISCNTPPMTLDALAKTFSVINIDNTTANAQIKSSLSTAAMRLSLNGKRWIVELY